MQTIFLTILIKGLTLLKKCISEHLKFRLPDKLKEENILLKANRNEIKILGTCLLLVQS